MNCLVLKVFKLTLAENAHRVRQMTWDLPLAEVARDRILASSCKESGLWLHAYPTPALGTLLDPEIFRIAVALRVGAKVSAAGAV